MAWRIVAAAGLLLAAGACLLTVVLFAKIDTEQKARAAANQARRSDNCRVFEGQHLQEVRQLRDTYRFLKGKPRPYQKGSIEDFAFKQLPRAEAESKSDSDLLGAEVPKYCDEPGVGRPEPDPDVPKRPKALR